MAEVDAQVLQKIDGVHLSQRAIDVREEFFTCSPGVSGDRARLTVESWEETEGDPIILRRAKLLKKVAEELPLAIFPGQLLACNDSKFFRGAHPHVDYDGSYLASQLGEYEGQMTLGGPEEKGSVDAGDLASLSEAVKYWKGKTVRERVDKLSRAVMGSWYDDLVEAGVNRHETFAWASGSFDFEGVVKRGLRGFLDEAKDCISQFVERKDDDVTKLYFWQAVVIVLEATIALARRYSSMARDMASSEKDPESRARLEAIAEACAWVPENPARSFHEAVQSIVLVHLALKLEAAAFPTGGWGRPDQYFYPYFKRDLEDGRLTMDQAVDLMSEFFLYSARLEWVMDVSYRDHIQKGYLINLAVGGPDASGRDASNELSYLILHVAGLIKLAEPHVVVRWHRGTPEWLMRKALETNLRAGGGIPQFQNSEHIVDYLVQRGTSLEGARCWEPYGCSQGAPPDSGVIITSYVNVPLLLDLTLHNGVASATGKRLGVETGDPRGFRTFDEFFEAFRKQADYVIRKQLWHDSLADRVEGEMFPRPLVSALFPGCLASGKDYYSGGCASYVAGFKKDRGIVSAADAMTAVKKLVFDDKRIGMSELLEAVDGDFEGQRGEEIRQMCLGAPKYGNDGYEADEMVRKLAKCTASIITSEKNIFGEPYTINRNGQAWHFMAGKRLRALPNGRKAGQPLADGSLSAMQGMDRNGPTALLNSALKADFKESFAGILNVKLSAPLLQTQELRDKVISMTQGFFKAGGTYIQYNILDTNVLRDAKLHPEKYRDLVVRVGGFSAYFIHLSPEVQDEIILRTEHSLAAV